MASPEEVAIFAIVTPAPGKLERFKELCDKAIARITAEEPDTLVFEYYEQEKDGKVSLALYERYKNQAAVEQHEASDSYKAFFKTIMEEQLLESLPNIFHGKIVKALRR